MEFLIGCVVGMVIGILTNMLISRTKKKNKAMGTLVIDKSEGKPDIYLALDDVPELLEEEEFVLFRVNTHK